MKSQEVYQAKEFDLSGLNGISDKTLDAALARLVNSSLVISSNKDTKVRRYCL